jgi:uncharacterized protein YpuA (DUF1002 family)
MFINSICTVISSIIVIFILHYLFEFFKKNLTSPKIKDLIIKPKNEYENIYKIINTDISHNTTDSESNNIPDTSNMSNSNIDSTLIKNELKNFFNDLNKTNNNNEIHNFQTVNENNLSNF